MSATSKSEIVKLKKINRALIDQVERSMDQQGNAFSLFQTAINLEGQISRRTQELTTTLAHLERSNHELKTAKDIAERANLSKTQFLAAASHDVMQPLNAALLLMSSLSTLQTSSEGARLCRQVERSLDTMNSLLRALLYMSRLDAGDVQPAWQSVSLDELFDSIASDFQPMAEQKSLVLRVRHNHLCVHSDPTMLRRILQNIVANAIRYTRHGGILLIAGHYRDRVRIRIADTGIGIDKSDYNDIFREFHRCGTVKDSQDQAYEGLGLGLAIVARMVNTLNHHLTLNSRLNHGSCFQLSLLAAEPPHQKTRHPSTKKPAMETQPGAGLPGKRVLLVENDFEVLQAMESLLKQWGCQLRLANSTEEALSALTRQSWRPDMIVADQHLDGDDLGTSTIKLVRTLAGARIPAVIVTANPSKSLALEAEEDDIEVMLKPIKPAQLRALLAHLLARETRVSETA